MPIKLQRNFFSLCLVAFMACGVLACGELDVEDETENQSSQENQANNETNNQASNQTNSQTNNQASNQASNQTNNQSADDTIEVAGEWETQFGSVEVIDEESWDFMALIDYDNEQRWAVTQNPDDAEFGPSTYNRIVWTPIEDDVFYYCTVDFGLETEEEAQTTDAEADADDLDGGCSDFEWTEMTRQ